MISPIQELYVKKPYARHFRDEEALNEWNALNHDTENSLAIKTI